MNLRSRKLLLIVLPALAGAVILAVAAWRRNDPESRYRAATVALENDPESQYRAAMVALDNGDLPAVAEAIQAMRQRSDSESRIRFLTGAYLLRSGDPAAALNELNSFEPDAETRIPTMLLICESCYRLGLLRDVESVARKLLEEQPDNANAHRWLSTVYYDLGANDAAMTQLARLAELRPDDFKPHRLMGLMHQDFHQHGKAIEHYRKALTLSPPPQIREKILSELASSLVAVRNYDQALKVLDDAKNSAVNLALRSECRWSLGDSKQAWALLESAKQMDPDERAALFIEARMHMAEGNLETAIIALERRLKRDPHDAECRYQLATALRRLGRTEDSEREMTKWQTATGLLDRLTALSKEAIRKPRDPEIRTRIADVCDQLGKHEQAEAWRRAARAYLRPASLSTSNSDPTE